MEPVLTGARRQAELPLDRDVRRRRRVRRAGRRSSREAGRPSEVTDEVKKSGLRGRGGAGFPTGVKWGFIPKDTKGKPVYLLCNADESEPGTFKDRLLMEQDPHLRHRGRASCRRYAIKCRDAYIYIRGEFYDGARILNAAIARGLREGLPRREHPRLRLRPRHLTCTAAPAPTSAARRRALIEIARGQARPAAHQAAVSRRRRASSACPTIVNNVETLACVVAHRQPRRRVVREDRTQREEHRAEALLPLRPRQPARRLRGADGPAAQGADLRRRLRARHEGRPQGQGGHSRRRVGADADRAPRSRTARSTSTASPPRARCSARRRSS